jgi:hypothetical protein
METKKQILLCEARGPLIDLIDKLSGNNGGEWLERLKKCLRQEGHFPVWGKISTNIYSDSDMLLEKLEKAEYISTDREQETKILIKKVTSENQRSAMYRLAEVTPKDLGFKGLLPPKLEEFYARAFEEGLELCPGTLGPELRLEYEGVAATEHHFIAMDPITNDDNQTQVFLLYTQLNNAKEESPAISSETYYKSERVKFDEKWLFVIKK